MFGISDLLTFVIGTIIIVLLPGPNSLYVALVTSHRGAVAGFKGAAGIFTGDAILMVLAIAGAATLVHGYPNLFNGIKMIGALYLTWLGIQLLLSLRQKKLDGEPSRSTRTPYRSALAISLVNPKAILFFASFFVQFIDPTYSNHWATYISMFIIVQIISQTYLAGLIGSTLFFKDRLHAESIWRRLLSIAVALFFFYFAISIGLEAMA